MGVWAEKGGGRDVQNERNGRKMKEWNTTILWKGENNRVCDRAVWEG
jgi:hypothetical protein